MLESNHLQLGRGHDHQYKTLVDKMQEDQNEAVWVRINLGIVLPETTPNILASGGHSPDTTSNGTTDGLVGSSDAQGRGWSTDVLETRVL